MRLIRDRIARLERRGMILIPQRDGIVARFPQSALPAAYLNLVQRAGAGESAPPEHPLLVAARNSIDPDWRLPVLWLAGCSDPEAWTSPVPDLSQRRDAEG